jgi:hypothetical protein
VRVDISRYIEDYPDWNGNLELPEDERIVRKWKNLSKRERDKFVQTKDQEMVIHNFGNKSNKEVEEEIEAQGDLHFKLHHDEDAMFKACEITFKNLSYFDGEKEVVIDTWDKLLNAPGKLFDDLIEDTKEKIRAKQEAVREQAKN